MNLKDNDLALTSQYWIRIGSYTRVRVPSRRDKVLKEIVGYVISVDTSWETVGKKKRTRRKSIKRSFKANVR